MSGILSDLPDPSGKRKRPSWPVVPADKGLLVRHRTTGLVGKVVRYSPRQVLLVDASGREHALPLAAGAFSAEGRTISLGPPSKKRQTAPKVTASGSIAPERQRARVARSSRILVEGIHDAELVEKIWGDDLRVEGVVVEPLHGADDLRSVIAEFAPTPERRLGILLDHLVDNSKESRIAAEALASTGSHPVEEMVLITGHDFVDIWAAIRPSTVGITAWPDIPKGVDWKEGMCRALGFQGTTGELWRVLLSKVSTYRDLEPSLVGAVEQLIDFVAPPPLDDTLD